MNPSMEILDQIGNNAAVRCPCGATVIVSAHLHKPANKGRRCPGGCGRVYHATGSAPDMQVTSS